LDRWPAHIDHIAIFHFDLVVDPDHTGLEPLDRKDFRSLAASSHEPDGRVGLSTF